MLSRRHLLGSALACGASALLPSWARSAGANDITGLRALSGTRFDLTVGSLPLAIGGRKGHAIAVNGQVPAPLLRWREGDEITLNVTNRLDVDTSIHWHGILVPNPMDGVPGMTFPGIRPGETFTYRFPVKQAGTYWYHSHSGLQEQSGHYGPIVIEPKGTDPVSADREYVLVLSDWTFMDPARLFATLKKRAHSLNYQRRTLGDFIRGVKAEGFGATLKDRLAWGAMRMDPTDIADVGGETYTYLVNGHGPVDNWTALFRPGERIRLRIINASAMTIFNFRIPGLPMTVVQADGQNVEPMETDEFQIGVAETYDVIVRPHEQDAYTIMCETIDRSGYARATLAVREGLTAPVPPLRERPLLTMKDMGMAHGDMAHGGMDHGPMDQGGMDQGMHGDHPPTAAMESQVHVHPKGAGVDNLAEMPVDRLGEPGLGLENVGHRVLTYIDLRSLAPNPDTRAPARAMEIHLTGNMERYMWSFDGRKFSEVEGPIVFHDGERLRLTLVNDTMMSHPIHLHGMFFEVVTGEHAHKPRKHTIIVKPGEKLSLDVTAGPVGQWAFHCHLLYHMVAGMMQTVSVRPDDQGMRDQHGMGEMRDDGDLGGHH